VEQQAGHCQTLLLPTTQCLIPGLHLVPACTSAQQVVQLNSSKARSQLCSSSSSR
jgi:hypothetical protein